MMDHAKVSKNSIISVTVISFLVPESLRIGFKFKHKYLLIILSDIINLSKDNLVRSLDQIGWYPYENATGSSMNNIFY